MIQIKDTFDVNDYFNEVRENKLKEKSISELLDYFEEICKKQDAAKTPEDYLEMGYLYCIILGAGTVALENSENKTPVTQAKEWIKSLLLPQNKIPNFKPNFKETQTKKSITFFCPSCGRDIRLPGGKEFDGTFCPWCGVDVVGKNR